MPTDPKPLTRRRFLGSTSAAAGSLLVLPSGTVRGQDSPANKLNVAFVGMGGRIQGHVKNTIDLGHKPAAFCDVDPRQAKGSADRHKKNAKFKGGDIKIYSDYRELLDKDEQSIDAVVISTPDHWHAPICKAAMKLGKAVYCEKPLTHTVAEARELRELTEKMKVVTQMGNQGSASNNIRRSIELIQAGLFGNVHTIHVWHPEHNWPNGVDRPEGSDPIPEGMNWDFWLGTAPERPYKKGIYHPGKWRGWYDFGNGSLGDFCCHGFNLPLRALKLTYPEKIDIEGTELGKETFAKSCTVKFRFPAVPGRNYPVDLIYYTGGVYPSEEVTKNFRKSFGRLPRTGALLVGDKGELSAGLWNNECKLWLNGEQKFFGADRHEEAKKIEQSLPRVQGQLHEWLDAVQGKTKAFADFEHGGHLTEIGLSGIVALKMQKSIPWDGEKMKVPGMPEADKFIDKEDRTKWL